MPLGVMVALSGAWGVDGLKLQTRGKRGNCHRLVQLEEMAQ